MLLLNGMMKITLVSLDLKLIIRSLRFFETFETDAKRKCYQMINMDDISRDEMVDYLDKETAYRRKELEELPDNELKSRYRSIYNARLKGIGVRNPT